MKLDLLMTQLAVKEKNFVVLDASFPNLLFPEFEKANDQRYIHVPLRNEMLQAYAIGLASTAQTVFVFGGASMPEFIDETLPVKWIENEWNPDESEFKTILSSYGVKKL